MDPAGAEALRLRLEQQRHWLLAVATSDGRQERADPDVSALQEIRENERLYWEEEGPFAKQLIDGRWERIQIVAQPGEDEQHDEPAARTVGNEAHALPHRSG